MDNLKNFLKGIVIGGTTMVPGVSGGTMALILGLYNRIIHSISSFFKDLKNNVVFLSVVGSGAVVGLVLVAGIISYSIDNFYFPSMFLFLGVVLGGMPVLYKEANVGDKKKTDWIYFILGALLIGGLIFFDRTYDGSLFEISDSLNLFKVLFLFLSGIIIAIALILPGISTSFLLLTLGLYQPIVDAIKNVNLIFLLPIVLGVLFGVITTTKILEKFMQEKPRKTYLLIIGFVVASMVEVFPGIPRGFDILYSIVGLLVGYYIIRYTSEKYK